MFKVATLTFLYFCYIIYVYITFLEEVVSQKVLNLVLATVIGMVAGLIVIALTIMFLDVSVAFGGALFAASGVSAKLMEQLQ